jgi:hypothetical protein
LTPYQFRRDNHAGPMLTRCMELVAAQTYPNVRHLVMPNDYPEVIPGRWQRLALANNRLMEIVPPDWGVLFIDHDIVDMSPSFITDIVGIAQSYEDEAIIAPQVIIAPAGNKYDGMFYDIGCYQNAAGQWATNVGGVPGDLMHEPMLSVGVGMYVPPGGARAMCRFHPVGDEIEKISYCRDWRDAGGTIYMARELAIQHANLPAYGLEWH